MYQTCSVDHLNDLGQSSMFFGEFPEPTDAINRYIWSQHNNQREREYLIMLTSGQQSLQWLVKPKKLKPVSSFSHQLQRFAQQQTSKLGFLTQRSNNDFVMKLGLDIGFKNLRPNYNFFANNKLRFNDQILDIVYLDCKLCQVNYWQWIGMLGGNHARFTV